MSLSEQMITIALCVVATVSMRLLPFVAFRANKPTPQYIQYLGKVLPGAVFSMLVVYCLRHVDVSSSAHGLPEFISVFVTIALHRWKRHFLISIAGGTLCYMLLVQYVFTKL